ncbi:Protein TonB [Georgfuchsia toluolica]|uniref:Protein TonB n=1 Tax=Georgfuchsia toluolica TaxID=424218 RepID=A0A916N1C4_9PROT|nr:TonB family protein [Georgfuchsia toluolica]CAG4884768.1 Protein TonB [Georgfuchsia toluolica]
MNSAVASSPDWFSRGGAFVFSLMVHAALLVWLLTTTLGGGPTALPPHVIALELVRPPPPPTAPPALKDIKPQPLPHAPAPVKPQPKKPVELPAPAGAPVHEFAKNDDDWVAVAPGAGTGRGAGGARRVPPDYADKVKTRVVAKLDYPPDAVYEPPPGYKGDPKQLKRQCTVPYEIVVDRNGKMISHHIEPCGDGMLDAAAEAALLKAGPFPPPPDLGAEQYVIYGSANFRTR